MMHHPLAGRRSPETRTNSPELTRSILIPAALMTLAFAALTLKVETLTVLLERISLSLVSTM
ncbi:MAG: hypothetical protein QNJ62_01685 [Methyloceanibacter sp.]|nr:hypothetical protein [Methyloceanibacter sp.]